MLLLALASLLAILLARVENAVAGPRPNIVLIQTDDQSMNTLRATYRDSHNRLHRVMPNTLNLIARRGAEFTNFYASHPVCGPSRAALLTGQYAHRSGLKRNSGPNGGWEGWQNLPLFQHNLATDLQRNGYRTTHIGKFTNNYFGDTPDTIETTVPPGWDRWHTISYANQLLFYGYNLNLNGAATGPWGSSGYDLVRSGVDSTRCTAARLFSPVPGLDCNHLGDRYSRAAIEEIEASGNQPFYIQIDHNTPHGDSRPPVGPEPPTRHYDTAFKNRMPRMPGFNEADVRDKPGFIRKAPRMSRQEINQIDTRWRKELEALRGVDDGVRAIIKTLWRTGKLKNTYLIYTSDNGLFHGEHRLGSAKFLPHEPAARVPMLISGPGIRAGRRSREVVSNIDIVPTILGLTGSRSSTGVDGRNLRPFWQRPARRTRRPILLESYVGPEDMPVRRSGSGRAGISIPAPPLNFFGLRVGNYKYIEYSGGERELYDLARDPHELHNRVRSPAYARLLRVLKRDLRRRRYCRGSGCRRVLPRLPRPRRR